MFFCKSVRSECEGESLIWNYIIEGQSRQVKARTVTWLSLWDEKTWAYQFTLQSISQHRSVSSHAILRFRDVRKPSFPQIQPIWLMRRYAYRYSSWALLPSRLVLCPMPHATIARMNRERWRQNPVEASTRSRISFWLVGTLPFLAKWSHFSNGGGAVPWSLCNTGATPLNQPKVKVCTKIECCTSKPPANKTSAWNSVRVH